MTLGFRAKAILGVALIEALLLALLVFSVLGFLHNSNDELLREHAHVTINSFGAMSRDAVISADLDSLDAIVHELAQNEGIVFARVIDEHGRLLAQAGATPPLTQHFADSRSIDDNASGVYAVSRPIEVAGVRYGTVQIGLDISSLQHTLVDARHWSVGIAVLEMGLVALFSLVLGGYLTRQIARFTEGAEAISAGHAGL